MSKNYTILQLDKHTWRLEDPFHTYLYLVEGTERAALIDCGNGFFRSGGGSGLPHRKAGDCCAHPWPL